MTRDDFCNTIKDKFPEISEKANHEYVRIWGDFMDSEYYSYSWFEALANAINEEMHKGTPVDVYAGLIKFISSSFESGGEEIKRAIDVVFVENLFWNVPETKAKSYWEFLPGNLKDLYVEFHHKAPVQA